jgi:predicted nucleotidyltransferase
VGARDPSAAPDDGAVLERLRALVGKTLAGRRADVYLFGSWARGDQRPSSDIDLAVHAPEPLPPGLLARLREALEESTIPYRVEVVDLAEADAAFRERVRREGIRWSASESA